MDFLFVNPDSAEWLYMWLWLELEIIEYSIDVWEYVGSYRQDGKTTHEFKHSITHNVISLKASETFTDKEIQKIIKIS